MGTKNGPSLVTVWESHIKIKGKRLKKGPPSKSMVEHPPTICDVLNVDG